MFEYYVLCYKYLYKVVIEDIDISNDIDQCFNKVKSDILNVLDLNKIRNYPIINMSLDELDKYITNIFKLYMLYDYCQYNSGFRANLSKNMLFLLDREDIQKHKKDYEAYQNIITESIDTYINRGSKCHNFKLLKKMGINKLEHKDIKYFQSTIETLDYISNIRGLNIDMHITKKDLHMSWYFLLKLGCKEFKYVFYSYSNSKMNYRDRVSCALAFFIFNKVITECNRNIVFDELKKELLKKFKECNIVKDLTEIENLTLKKEHLEEKYKFQNSLLKDEENRVKSICKEIGKEYHPKKKVVQKEIDKINNSINKLKKEISSLQKKNKKVNDLENKEVSIDTSILEGKNILIVGGFNGQFSNMSNDYGINFKCISAENYRADNVGKNFDLCLMYTAHISHAIGINLIKYLKSIDKEWIPINNSNKEMIINILLEFYGRN